MYQRACAILVVAAMTVAAYADYTLPSFDMTVNLAGTVPLDTAGVPVDTYIAAIVTVEWTGLDSNARSDRAMWGIRVQGGDPADPNTWYCDPSMAVDSVDDATPRTLHFFTHFYQPYYADVPLEFTAEQTYGTGATWENITITLITTSPVPFAMQYLSMGTLMPGDSIEGDTTGAMTSLYGKNEVRRDGSHNYYGGRWYMGWEDAGDDVYTLDWPGGDLRLDLVEEALDGDLDLFLWGNQTPCLAWSYGQTAEEQIRVADLPAGTYWVHIDGWQASEQKYTLNVTRGFYEPYIFSDHRNTFNNFGPGDTYREQETQVNGLVISFNETSPDGWDQGPRIVPLRSGYVTEVVAATHMAAWDDDNIVELWICENESAPGYPIGRPGTVLEKLSCKEEMNIAALSDTTTPIYFPASGETYLQAGEVYWLIASSPGPHDSDVTWARNNQWQSGGPGSLGDYAAREGSGEEWMIRTNYPYKLPACRIVVADRTPRIVPGDCDCDMDVDYFDINFFIAALGDDEPAWQALHLAKFGMEPACPFANCDADGNGGVDYFDIQPFLDLLGA